MLSYTMVGFQLIVLVSQYIYIYICYSMTKQLETLLPHRYHRFHKLSQTYKNELQILMKNSPGIEIVILTIFLISFTTSSFYI